jgi:putative ABC transport system permease protein
MAALFGMLVTLAFALLPLGRARDVPATALFREMGLEGRACRGWSISSRPGYCAAFGALAVLVRRRSRIASIFVGATIFSFLVLRAVGAAGAMGGEEEPARALRPRFGSPSATSTGPAR